jgi:hypothetical protein
MPGIQLFRSCAARSFPGKNNFEEKHFSIRTVLLRRKTIDHKSLGGFLQMAQKIDKVIICNQTALEQKYGAQGVTQIEQAINKLAEADQARSGLTSKLFWIDDAGAMNSFNTPVVTNAKNEQQCKDAVDAIAVALSPDYIVLLDGPDVIPHISLDNVGLDDDPDKTIASDLPYACDAPFRANDRSIDQFLAVTRVVGRLPAAPCQNPPADPTDLINLIDKAALHQPRALTDYTAYFGISADVWRQSTELTLQGIFGNYTRLVSAPPAAHTNVDPLLVTRAHLINCHGATLDYRFYGQQGNSYPVALNSVGIAPHVQDGSIVAAECCYGAELYDFKSMGHDMPICLTYLAKGALGFVGSTNIAYGAATDTSQADCIVQYFLQNILKGASTGRAFLQARQQFIQRQIMASPVNLKTIAQFLLLGDSSLQPCEIIPPKSISPRLVPVGGSPPIPVQTAADIESQRKVRRISLVNNGIAVAETASQRGERIAPSDIARDRILSIAQARGFRKAEFDMFEMDGRATLRSEAKSKSLGGDVNERIAVMTEVRSRTGSPGAKDLVASEADTNIHVLIVHMLGDGIATVEQCESR